MEYIATAHPPSSVTHSLLSSFTSPSIPSLIILRTSSIELLNLLPSGPSPALPNGPFQLWGRILGAQVINSNPSNPSSSLPLLVVLLDAPKPLCLFLRWNEEKKDLEVVETVSVNGGVGATEAEFYQGVEVDEERGVVLLTVWRGMVTVIVLKNEEGEAEGKGKKKNQRRESSIRGGGEKESGVVRERFDVQLKQLNVLSLTFLPTTSPSASSSSNPNPNPTLLLLSLTPTRTPHLTSHTIDLASKDLLAPSPDSSEGEGPSLPLLSAHIPDPGANILVPLPRGGVMVLGEKEVVVFEVDLAVIGSGGGGEGDGGGSGKGKGKGKEKESEMKKRRRSSAAEGGFGGVREKVGPGPRGVSGKLPAFGEIKAYSVFDTTDQYTRVLLGDSYGRLTLATLKRTGAASRVSSIEFLVLGQIPSPTTLTYLSSSHLFVGSHFGDSLITSILPSPLPYTGSYLSSTPLLTLPNLAPILDFWKDGEEGDVVTCSGGQNTGSLRVVRRGVGLVEGLVVEGVEGVERVWGLSAVKRGEDSKIHTIALLSTSNSTLLISLGSSNSSDPSAMDTTNDDHNDVSLLPPSTSPGLDHHVPTLAAGNAGASHIVQITKTGVVVVDVESGNRVDEWNSPSEVAVAAFDGETVLVAARGGILSSLKVTGGKVSLNTSITLPSEISSLTLSTPSPTQPSLAALSLWSSNTLLILNPSTLKTISTPPPTPSLARSLLFASLASKGQRQLLVGLGEGSVIVQEIGGNGEGEEEGKFERRTIGLGTTEVNLSFVGGDGETEGSVFASCDRPSVLHEDHGRLGYSAVNLKNVTTAAHIDSSAFPSSLVLVTPTTLIFGKINEMKKVHVQSIPFGHDVPYRIAYHPSLRAYGVAFVKTVLDRREEQEDMTSSFKLLDEDTFEPTFTHDLGLGERASSLEALTLNGRPFFALGTGIIDRDKVEIQEGRVLLFGEAQGVPGGKMELVSQFAVGGGVYALAFLEEQSKLAASVNSRVLLFDISPDHQLSKSAVWGSAYMPATLAPIGGDRLLVGDAMSSMSVVEVGDKSLRTIAKDARPLWMSTVAPLSEGVMIGGDSNYNILTMKLNDKNRLENGGAFNIGELVNRFRKGSLVPNQPGSSARSNLILATSSGRLSTIVDLDSELSRLLFDLQRNMSRVVEGPGGVTFASWRDFKTDNGTSPSVGFIDGDLVEKFLEIKDEEMMRKIMDGSNKYEKLSVSEAEMCVILEGLRRLH